MIRWMVVLLVFAVSGCLGNSQPKEAAYTVETKGKVTTYRSNDDVSQLSQPVPPRLKEKMGESEQLLEKALNNLLAGNKPNSAAYVAAHAPAKFDAFVRQWITERLGTLPAPFYYAMAAKYDATDTKAALQWFMRGHVLAVVDAKMCRDTSARQGVSFLSSLLGENLRNQYDEFEKSGLLHQERLAALEYARNNPQDYTPMWICSHGLSTFMDGGNKGYLPLEQRAEKIDEMEKTLPQQ